MWLKQLGEMLQATPKNSGAKGIGPIAVERHDRNKIVPPTLAEIGISKTHRRSPRK
jgi:hypothetical protein